MPRTEITRRGCERRGQRSACDSTPEARALVAPAMPCGCRVGRRLRCGMRCGIWRTGPGRDAARGLPTLHDRSVFFYRLRDSGLPDILNDVPVSHVFADGRYAGTG